MPPSQPRQPGGAPLLLTKYLPWRQHNSALTRRCIRRPALRPPPFMKCSCTSWAPAPVPTRTPRPPTPSQPSSWRPRRQRHLVEARFVKGCRMLDFGALPPEINSTRMYAGPGSGSMVTAAATWEGLAADLRSQATAYSSVISGLTSDGWRGPASTSMATAAAPYAAWMNTTAAQAEETAQHAQGAGAAYEAAFSATVPPSVIAANRAQLASLVATNFLGQNTPAIAATEVHYGEMWAQDHAAMSGTAGSWTPPTQLTPLSGPTQNTNAGALAGQSGAVAQATTTSAGTGSQALAQLVTTVPNTCEGVT